MHTYRDVHVHRDWLCMPTYYFVYNVMQVGSSNNDRNVILQGPSFQVMYIHECICIIKAVHVQA